MRDISDGFIIAEKDLELRGSGEILGTKQTGYRAFKVANLQRNQNLLPALSPIANQLLSKEPETAKKITKRWLGEYEQFLQG